MLYAEEKKALDAVVKTLTGDNKLKATVSGYTCDIGPGEKNDKLSAMRANSVLTYLMINGIDETRITVKHFGEVESKAENEKDKELNRRVDVIYSY
jgi:outer membrane protein OmpA-like peptidoglycan-associated protein